MRYTNFDIEARKPQFVKSDGRKRLLFDTSVPGITGDPVPCELDARVVDELKDRAGGPDADWSDALALGEALAGALLPPVVFNALNLAITQAQGAPEEGVRVRLILTGSELNNLPWEFLVFNRAGGEATISDFLALLPKVSLVRYPVATALPAWRIAAKAPAKVLVAVASPSNLTKLDVAGERDLVVKALEESTLFTVSGVEHAQRGQLPDHRNPAHIFHFAGHGKFDRAQSAQPGAYEGTGSIILEDAYGDPDQLDAGQLAVQLRDAGVRVAVLGACESAERDDLNAWSSVAEALLKADVGAVLGMQFPVRDASALLFAQRFYGSLALGLSIDEATAAGRVAIAGATPEDARGWATPVLYLHSPDGVIFSEFRDDPALAGEREQAKISARQEIDSLKGKATNVRIGRMHAGALDARQRAKEVEATGTLENLVIGTLEGGQVDATQMIDKVKGKATNVAIDTLCAVRSAVVAKSKVGEVSADGSLTGVKIGTLGTGTGGVNQTLRQTRTTARTTWGISRETAAPHGSATADDRERPRSFSAEINVGSVSGGQVIGVQDNRISGDSVGGNKTVFDVDGNLIIIPGASPPPVPKVHTIEEKIRLDVALPSSVVVDEPFTLMIAVRQPDAPILAVADLDQVVHEEGSIFRTEDSEIVQYRIKVVGRGFQVDPPSFLLKLRPGENSRPVAFQVVGTKPGKRSLFVNAYQQDGTCVAQTRLQIKVTVAVQSG